jgi:hypothetical protein
MIRHYSFGNRVPTRTELHECLAAFGLSQADGVRQVLNDPTSYHDFSEVAQTWRPSWAAKVDRWKDLKRKAKARPPAPPPEPIPTPTGPVDTWEEYVARIHPPIVRSDHVWQAQGVRNGAYVHWCPACNMVVTSTVTTDAPQPGELGYCRRRYL